MRKRRGNKCQKIPENVVVNIKTIDLSRKIPTSNEVKHGKGLLYKFTLVFLCLCPVIDQEFRDNTVKVAVDPQTTLTMS